MKRLSYLTETVLSEEITRNRIVLSVKDSPRKPLGRRPGFGVRLGAITVAKVVSVWRPQTLSPHQVHIVTIHKREREEDGFAHPSNKRTGEGKFAFRDWE